MDVRIPAKVRKIGVLGEEDCQIYMTGNITPKFDAMTTLTISIQDETFEITFKTLEYQVVSSAILNILATNAGVKSSGL